MAHTVLVTCCHDLCKSVGSCPVFEKNHLRDSALEQRVFQQRMIASLVLFFFLAALLAWRYVNLQVFQYEKFATASDRNRIHTLPLEPRRGLIYDRKGVLLAENQPSYSLSVTIERVANLDELLIDLQQLFDIDTRSVEKFRQRLNRRTPYQAVPLKFRLNDDEISRFSVNRYRLDGVEIKAQLVRHYPRGEDFSHVIGYVGRINKSEQEKIFSDEQRRINYAATDHIGKIGLENYYEEILHGVVGSQYVESNAHGRVLRVLQQVDPLPGDDLQLSVDAELQQTVVGLLKGRRGSVVVLDVHTGDVLAMVSAPSFDSNLFVNGISNESYGKLRDSIDLPLFNRSLQGQYPPGSTIKPIIGLAALYHGLITSSSTINDPGWYQLPNDERYHRDWKREGHGDKVDLFQAIEQSCDTFFYDISYRLGIDRIHAFTKQFGLGEKTGIDSFNERSGLLPSRAWKRASRNKPWFPGETLNIGIGQGYMLVTPLQLAVSTAALATRGERIEPRFILSGKTPPKSNKEEVGQKENINALINASENNVSSHGSENQLDDIGVSDYFWDEIHDAMKSVVHGRKGTAQAIGRNIKYKMAGKTGTAQVIGIAQGEEYDVDAITERQRDHALFVGFAPFERPKFAVAVIIENGGSGSATAAPIARKVFDWLMLNDTSNDNKAKPAGRELPVYASNSQLTGLGVVSMNDSVEWVNNAF